MEIRSTFGPSLRPPHYLSLTRGVPLVSGSPVPLLPNRVSIMAARSAPPSRPLAVTLFNGLGPGSLRVHDPCKDVRHGSRLGFPGRRSPRGPAASPKESGVLRTGNVARALQVLPNNKARGESGVFGRARGAGPGPGGTWFAGGRGPAAGAQRRWGWPSFSPLDPCGAEGPAPARPTHGIVPPGKPHSPSPSGLLQRGLERGAEGAGAHHSHPPDC